MLRRKGFTLVEIMIVVAIIALLAAVALPNLMRARLTAAQANAQSTLRTISTALESYAAGNRGNYPVGGTAELNGALHDNANPPYINDAYCGDTVADAINMYWYSCNVADVSHYIIQAIPVATSGGVQFEIREGGVMQNPLNLGG